MRTLSRLAVAGAMALTISGVLASSAWAESSPTFVPTKGAEGFPAAFTVSGGPSTVEELKKQPVVCQSKTGSGKFASASEARMTITFTGCYVREFGPEGGNLGWCTSTG